MSNVWKPNSPISVPPGQRLPAPPTPRLKRPRSPVVPDLVPIAPSSSRFRFKTVGGGASRTRHILKFGNSGGLVPSFLKQGCINAQDFHFGGPAFRHCNVAASRQGLTS